MKFKSLIFLAIVILALLLSSGCDSISEALEFRQRYEALQEKVEELEDKLKDQKDKYKAAQKELKNLRANKKYIENTI